jgi:hypothetical protein
MDNPTPEEFLIKINIIDISANLVDENDENASEELGKYYNELSVIRGNIQTQIDLIVNDKPVKSEQMLKDYSDIYNATYMTNFCLFLGICLILWYIFGSNTNPNTNVQANVKTS